MVVEEIVLVPASKQFWWNWNRLRSYRRNWDELNTLDPRYLVYLS